MTWLRGAGADRRSFVIATIWCVLVAVALKGTLDSLRVDDFDGLNNIFQIPFALPWFLMPIGTSSHQTNAWIAAAMGWLNGLIILLFLPEWRRRHGQA